MNKSELEAIKARAEAATPGPWAWDQYGEKENCFHVGVALNKQDEPLCGRVETERYIEDEEDPNFGEFVEDIIWHEAIGNREGATVNYDDAEFIAHARTDIPKLIAEVERWRSLSSRLLIVVDELEPTAGDVYAEEDDRFYALIREIREALGKE